MEEKLAMWTIGHGNRSIGEFLLLLKDYGIEVLADVRRFPTSRVEHFRKEKIEMMLRQHGIEYVWLGDKLGGYRRGGYKRHMETKAFREGIRRLLEIARDKRVCIMCMEVKTKYCHRRFISAHLEEKGVNVEHIIERRQKTLLNNEIHS